MNQKTIASSYDDISAIVSSNASFLLSPDWGRIFIFSKLNFTTFVSDAQLKIICESLSESSIEEIYFSDPWIEDEAHSGRYDCVAEMIEKSPSMKLLSFDGNFPFKENEAKLIGEAIGKNKNLVIFDSYAYRRYPKALFIPILEGVYQSESIRLFAVPKAAADDRSLLFDYLIKLISNDAPCKIQFLDLVTNSMTSEEKDLKSLKRLLQALEKNTLVHTLVFNIAVTTQPILTKIFEEIDSILNNNFILQRCLFSSKVLERPESYTKVLEKLKRNKRISIFKRSINSFLLLYLITKDYYLPREIRGIICELYVDLFLFSMNEDSFMRPVDFKGR